MHLGKGADVWALVHSIPDISKEQVIYHFNQHVQTHSIKIRSKIYNVLSPLKTTNVG